MLLFAQHTFNKALLKSGVIYWSKCCISSDTLSHPNISDECLNTVIIWHVLNKTVTRHSQHGSAELL